MTFQEIMETLKAMGSPQNRKYYKKLGAKDKMFGVSLGNLKSFSRNIKNDFSLAGELWATENIDARILATMIMDKEKLTGQLIRQWVLDISFYPLGDYFVRHLAILSQDPAGLIDEWCDSDGEYIRRCGYVLLYAVAKNYEDYGDAFYVHFINRISHEIDDSPALVKEAMNNALIRIGKRNEKLRHAAIKAFEMIGKVNIDSGISELAVPDGLKILRIFQEKTHNTLYM